MLHHEGPPPAAPAHPPTCLGVDQRPVARGVCGVQHGGIALAALLHHHLQVQDARGVGGLHGAPETQRLRADGPAAGVSREEQTAQGLPTVATQDVADCSALSEQQKPG